MSQLRAVAAGFGWRTVPPPAGARAVLWSIAVAVGAAWVGMIAMLASMGAHPVAGAGVMPGMPAMTDMPRAHASMFVTDGLGAVGVMWSLMMVAMMLPSALPAVRHVGTGSLRWRRRRAMTMFVTAYLAIWAAFGVLVVSSIRLWPGAGDQLAAALALSLAAAWQLTPYKRRALSDCHRPSPLPPRGRRATLGVLRFAVLNAAACIRSCWALMLAMVLVPSMPIFWMVAITGIVTVEKFAAKPRQAVRASAALLGVAAFLVALSALTP